MNISKKYHHYGISFEFHQFYIFFGNQYLDYENVKKLFPINFNVLKQVHGNGLVKIETLDALNKNFEADAQTTDLSDLGLIIKTADCMPVFVVDPSEKQVLGIHAGWRGVGNKIVPLSIKNVFPKSKEIVLFLGAYIHQKSFELDEYNLNLLLSTVSADLNSENKVFHPSANKGKYMVNLRALLELQIIEHLRDVNSTIINLEIDTYTDSNYFSYRRDKKNFGRNHSFIYRKSE